MKPESKLWQLVRKNLPDIHWTRIESWVNQGVPDCYGILDGTSVFVELKVTRSNKINLSPFQKNWLYNHYLQGGRSFILLQHLGQRALYLFSSSILHSPLSIASKHEYKCSLPAGSAAWSRIQDTLLHSPLARKPEDPPL
jgi:penicillin-binding protein-related factor A (putative recombinase)